MGLIDVEPSTADWFSVFAQILSNDGVSNHNPPQRAHSSTFWLPTFAIVRSCRQRGQCFPSAETSASRVAAAPHRGQCLLPTNIIAKHDGQATVARIASQYWHCGLSVDVAAPHIGQLIVPASIDPDSTGTFALCALSLIQST